MLNFMERVKENARSLQKCLVLAEGNDLRILQAGRMLVDEQLVKELVILDSRTFGDCGAKTLAAKHGLDLSGIELLEPEASPNLNDYAASFYELRKQKGISQDDALEAMKNPLNFAAMMLRQGHSDALVAGAVNSTANVLRAGFTIIKTAPGVKLASSCFVMDFSQQPALLNGRKWGSDGLMLFADCAVNPEPNAEELAEIALQSAVSCRKLLGAEPVVALLSFSSKGSAKHAHVDRVVQALEIAKAKAPDLQIDGELQLDAAIDVAVGQSKAPGSCVAGKANVLVFPDLQSGNIGYKLVQRFAGAQAYGPFLQGFALPITDLSRGCSVEDIVNTSAVTLVQTFAQTQ